MPAEPGGRNTPTTGQVQLMLPIMKPARGRLLFAEKGCVACHAVNGVGGEDAPPLDVSDMGGIMNPFDFAANMWRGAEAMIILQRDELGAQIELTGQELADIVAFVHSPDEQQRFSIDDVPEHMREMMNHGHEDGGHD